MTDLRIQSREGLEKVDDLLHDRWFDIDDVQFDEASHLLQVPFRDLSKGAGRATGAKPLVLEVRYVEQRAINDTEGVGLYDFNRLVASRDGRTLRIETGVPIGFEIMVTELDVRVCDLE